jgi:trigger factor
MSTATVDAPFKFDVQIEDAGPGAKKLTVKIPQEHIDAKLAEQMKELRTFATLPGFRPGKIPQALLEKRFGGDVREQVRKNLVSDSFRQAVEEHNLQILGEPDVADPKALELSTTGGMNFVITVEVQPTIELPSLKGIKVKKPKITVTDANVDQAMQNLREQQGTLVPVADNTAAPKDFLVGDFKLKLDGTILGQTNDAQLVVRNGRIAGIEVPDLEGKLTGIKAGESRSFTVAVPDTHPQEQIKGKTVEIDVSIKDVKRLELAVIDQDFLESLGFENEGELREALREQLVQRIDFDVQQAMRSQVAKHLLENVNFTLPAKLSQMQANRVLNRRATDLLSRGVPRQQIEANLAALAEGTGEEAQRELKLFFTLQKIANERDVQLDEATVNGRIAMIAATQGLRPEKLKQQMAKDGSLQNLYLQMREQAALDTIIVDAEIEEVAVDADKASQMAENPATSSEHSAT